MAMMRRLLERRAFSGPWGPYSDGSIPPASWEGGNSTAGAVVTERTSLMQADVWSCASLIADAIAMLPMNGYRDAGDYRKPLSPQPRILVEPSPEMDAVDWRNRMALSAVLRGRALATIDAFDGLGTPTSATPIHPDDYYFSRGEDGATVVRMRNGVTLRRSDVIYVKGLTLPGHHHGMGPVEYHRRAIGLGIATEEFGANWFRDGAAPSSVLESDEVIDDVDARKHQARWIASHGGRRRPAVLSAGLKWRAITLTPNESQFLETMKFNTERIARLFRVPPHMIGAVDKSTSWGTGIEEQGIGFVVFTLGIWLARFEAELSRRLPRPQYVKSNVSALLRGNTRDRYLSYAIGRQWGWLSVNDIRRLEDLAPVDDGDVYLQPLNMVDASEALKVLIKNSGTAA